MDFDLEMALTWLRLAESVNGNAELGHGGMLCIRLSEPDAPRLQNVITNEDWPYSYVIARFDDNGNKRTTRHIPVENLSYWEQAMG